METVLSKDKTTIAFERSGNGPPLVLVHGTTADHTRWAPVLPGLERHFTVFAMDRRGRGASGDAEAFALEKEYEDVAEVVRSTGGATDLLGHSYGGLCALEAALLAGNLRRLVLYEPAFATPGTKIYEPGIKQRLEALVQEGDRELLLTTFFRDVAQMSEADIGSLKAAPSWQGRLAAAHTAVRELADGDYVFEPERFRKLDVPTLLLVGSESPPMLTMPIQLLASVLPDARVVVMPGQGHAAMNTAPDLFLREVIAFLTEDQAT
jgi:pimeloyl-ACP methyl ester carboxylesterase